MKTVTLQLYGFASWTGTERFVLLNGPVPECLRLVHGKELPVPKVGTHCCQHGNHRLPLQGTAGSQRLERMVPNLGTRGYHCKQLPVPTWEPQVTIAKNFQFLKVGTDGSQRGNQRLPWQGTAGSQTLKLTVPNGPNLGTRGYHCKELPVPRSYNFMFSKLSSYHCKELRVPKLETHGSKPEKVTFPVEGSVDCKKLELMVLNVVLFCLLSR